MNSRIRLLHLEDDARDAELIRLWLGDAGLSCDIQWVKGKESFESAVDREAVDLVLSDYNLRGYDGMSALGYVRARKPELPVIIISGGLSEEEAVDCLKAGAADYVLKQRPQRLETAVRRALVERDERAALRHAQEEIFRQNVFLRQVIDLNPNYIFAKDREGRFVLVNKAMAEAYGTTVDQLTGKTVTEVSPNAQHVRFLATDIEAMDTLGEVRVAEEKIVDSAGNVRWLQTVKRPIVAVDGTADRMLGVAVDITERKRADEDIRALNASLEDRVRARTAEAEAANRAKSTFLATMSHEIRTPMNGMFGMLELLSLGQLNPEQRATLEVVRESSRSLLRIIDDILDFSRIEAGKLEVRPEAASINAVIQHVHDIYAGSASGKGLLLTRSVDPRISPALMVDPLRLRQILTNFVSNALKFTVEGTIEIKAEMIACADRQERVRFSVQDTGIGISRQDQERLFHPFSQIDGETARQTPGTGLGLTICRRLAELMGGRVDMQSEPGKGTTMTLTLSLPIADPQDMPAPDSESLRGLPTTSTGARRIAPSMEQAQADGTLVLVVDDHPINRTLLLRQVQMLGYAVHSADDGAEALEKWKTGRFGMVITDCNMPRMDGYELARMIRRIEAAEGRARVPIIACTANALTGEAAKCIDAGMDDCLVKPIQLSHLLKGLDHWMPIPDGPAIAPLSWQPEAAQTNIPVDLSLIAATWGGDAKTVRGILATFRAGNDEDAAKLREAVAARDGFRIAHSAHRMLGASRMVGALDFAQVCEQIDQATHVDDLNTVRARMEAFERERTRLIAYIESL